MTNNIVDKFIQENAKQIGGIKVFTHRNAKELVGLLIKNQHKILGLDGIFVNQEGHRPSMEDSILTYGLYDKKLSSVQIEAKIFQFIQQRANKKDLLFEIIFK